MILKNTDTMEVLSNIAYYNRGNGKDNGSGSSSNFENFESEVEVNFEKEKYPLFTKFSIPIGDKHIMSSLMREMVQYEKDNID
mmetsp:Transcript_148/g.213  ORF Transcript_148/g.213 Transcript_148/m.213 type:complete len:83 (+) Transcript_148:608-856(+)